MMIVPGQKGGDNDAGIDRCSGQSILELVPPEGILSPADALGGQRLAWLDRDCDLEPSLPDDSNGSRSGLDLHSAIVGRDPERYP